MSENNEWDAKTAREKVIIYRLLNKLDMYLDNKPMTSFLIFPVTAEVLKQDIKNWITTQHKMLSREVDE